ncbi:MAG: hypothetical protein V1858_00860 [Candidatus Gottesmanbacteria bacterium]
MRKAILISVPIIIIILIIGILFWRSRSTSSNLTATPGPQNTTNFSLPENQEKGVDVSLTAHYDKKAVILKVSKIPSSVISIEYEISYTTKAGLPRGVLGKMEIKNQDSILRDVLLGTCSRNVCVYDEGVTKVSLTLKFNKSSGPATGFYQDYEL